MDFTQNLVSLGLEFVEAHNWKNLLCAFAGGSVGRGEADRYSDLDLNFYLLKGTVQPYSQNIRFRDKIIAAVVVKNTGVLCHQKSETINVFTGKRNSKQPYTMAKPSS